MAWTEKFKGVDYKERAELLLPYLRQRCSRHEPTYPAYMDVLRFIAGGLSVRSEYRYVSQQAKEILIAHGAWRTPIPYSPTLPDKNLTKEHTIPVNVIVEHLASLSDDKLTTDYLADFIEKVSGLALITKDEDKLINNFSLRSTLPSDTVIDNILNGSVPHYVRYEKAGIIIAATYNEARP